MILKFLIKVFRLWWIRFSCFFELDLAVEYIVDIQRVICGIRKARSDKVRESGLEQFPPKPG